MPTDRHTCEYCDEQANHHKYHERLCSTHFYRRWREVNGLA